MGSADPDGHGLRPRGGGTAGRRRGDRGLPRQAGGPIGAARHGHADLRARGQQRRTRAATPVDSLESIRGARILLAEDNEINQQVATELLEGAGLEVAVANNGREAVDAVGKAEYDLVLMDIQMPEMDGFQATAEIRKDARFRDLPILAMTTQALVGDREKSLAAGMNDHVTKPIDPDQLFATLAKWLGNSKTKPPRAGAPLVDEEGRLPSDLAGISVASGLRKAAGNERLYRNLLLKFRSTHERVDGAGAPCAGRGAQPRCRTLGRGHRRARARSPGRRRGRRGQARRLPRAIQRGGGLDRAPRFYHRRVGRVAGRPGATPSLYSAVSWASSGEALAACRSSLSARFCRSARRALCALAGRYWLGQNCGVYP